MAKALAWPKVGGGVLWLWLWLWLGFWVWVWDVSVAVVRKTKPQMGIMSVRRRLSRKGSLAQQARDNAARSVSYY